MVAFDSLPTFDLQGYGALLDGLGDSGYAFHRVSDIGHDPTKYVVFLRHDVDLHIQGVEQMALVEAARGIPATYYVPLTLHFNPLYPVNQRILRQIRNLGHEIGLHYNMATYPVDPVLARAHLDWEVGVLSKVIGHRIRSICMHQPHQGEPDPFRGLDDYVHPHDPRYESSLLYISDSCRAWRDESLATCFGPNRPRRLLLNTHPELWLDGSLVDRMQYLDQVLMKNGVSQHRDYFDQEVRQVWVTHPAPKLHDDREGRKATTSRAFPVTE